MTDPEVKDDNAVRVYVPTDVRPEMLDGPEAQALRNELDEARARLAEEQTAHATLRALWDARCGTIASVQARLEEAEGKLRHNVRAEAEFRALTADVNADRERELFATEEKLAAVQARLTEAEGLLGECIADGEEIATEGLYALGLRAGRANVSDVETDFCIVAADAIEDRVRAFLAPRPEPVWYGVRAIRHGVESHWHQLHDGSRAILQTTHTEATRVAAALNEFAIERQDSIGWTYEVREYRPEPAKGGGA